MGATSALADVVKMVQESMHSPVVRSVQLSHNPAIIIPSPSCFRKKCGIEGGRPRESEEEGRNHS